MPDHDDLDARMMEFVGLDPELHVNSMPSYATDWSRTGPLIERHGVLLCPLRSGRPSWLARVGDEVVFAEKPLLAVCRVLLAARERGVL